MIAALLAGGIAQVVAGTSDPQVETTVRDVEVLPADHAEISGRIDRLVAEDAVGSPLPVPFELATGGATIEGALVDGERSTIEWDGGRPFRLHGDGAVDLGPTRVEVGVGGVFWSVDGIRVLTPGAYSIETPVAVGRAGLATPRDAIAFTADEETTIETRGGATLLRGLPVHVEGPGTVTADGTFRVTTRSGTVDATRLEFGPGPFVIDVLADQTITATFNGPLTSR